MSVNHEERAYRAWPILIERATNGKQMTYGDLGELINVHPHAISHTLGVIQNFCLEEGLPPLTVLVINKTQKLPGEGFIAWNRDDLEAALHKVLEFKWKDIANPFSYAKDGASEEMLVEELVQHPENAAEIYTRVKTRGILQSIFRKALFKVYKCQCAFCGLTFENALEAAHIVPWGEVSIKERFDLQNGLLLCATHHRLFDSGLITLNHKGNIWYFDPTGKDGIYSSSDHAISLAIHGKPAFLPINPAHHPSQKFLTRHYETHDWTDYF